MDKQIAQRAGIAFKLGMAFGQGMARARNNLTQDEAKWITVKPHGENAKGRPALIDGETGQILGGMGGKFNGRHITKANKTAQKAEQNKPKSRREQLLEQRQKNNQMDYSLPEKVDKSVIIQNRDRTSQISQTQIREIAKDPDYMRLSNNSSLSDGAPVIAYGTIPQNQLGKVTTAVASDGTRYKVQYAVIDADAVETSHNINGAENEKFYSDDPNITRAIAGNGRLTGLKKAYEQGTAGNYNDELLLDDSHGVNSDVIEKMKKPVLVRVMQAKDITKDIGDKTNTQSNLQLSSVEQANNDKNRVKFDEVETYANGEPTIKAVSEFVYKLPVAERGNLIDADGKPTKQAQERLKGALFAKAYNDDTLLRLAHQANDPDGKNILNALELSAPKLATLENLPKEYDIRPVITFVANQAIKAKQEGKSLDEFIGQTDLFQNEKENSANNEIMKLFANNLRSPKTISEKLNQLADTLQNEVNAPDMDLFGAVEKRSKDQIIKSVLTQDSKNRIISFWDKNLYLLMSDDKRKHKKCFDRLHKLTF